MLDLGRFPYINTDGTAFAVDNSDPYTIDEKTVLRDKNNKVVAIGKADISDASKGNFSEGDQVEVKATNGVATEIKRLATKEEVEVAKALGKVKDAYVVPHNTADMAVAAKGLVETDIANNSITVSVTHLSGDTYKVTLKHNNTTVEATKNITVTKDASNVATLSELKYNNTPVANFNANTTEYTVTLPYGTDTVPTVTATATDQDATIKITQAKSLTGTIVDRTAEVIVTAANGKTTKAYTITFEVAQASQP